jgi:hypothetical protein
MLLLLLLLLLLLRPVLLHARLVAALHGCSGPRMIHLKVWWPPQRHLRHLDQDGSCEPPHDLTLEVETVHTVHGVPAAGQQHTRALCVCAQQHFASHTPHATAAHLLLLLRTSQCRWRCESRKALKTGGG